MRAVIQRVRAARVTVEGKDVGHIGPGILAFIGVAPDDGPADIEYVSGKIRDLRIFPDEQDRMNRSVLESGGAVLVVSQFTLYGDCRKGRRPSFDRAASPATAEALYNDVLAVLRSSGLHVESGIFQARMDVELVNDGPVTMLLDSRRTF